MSVHECASGGTRSPTPTTNPRGAVGTAEAQFAARTSITALIDSEEACAPRHALSSYEHSDSDEVDQLKNDDVMTEDKEMHSLLDTNIVNLVTPGTIVDVTTRSHGRIDMLSASPSGNILAEEPHDQHGRSSASVRQFSNTVESTSHDPLNPLPRTQFSSNATNLPGCYEAWVYERNITYQRLKVLNAYLAQLNKAIEGHEAERALADGDT